MDIPLFLLIALTVSLSDIFPGSSISNRRPNAMAVSTQVLLGHRPHVCIPPHDLRRVCQPHERGERLRESLDGRGRRESRLNSCCTAARNIILAEKRR